MTTGLMFPGQGSQSVGMLADVAELFPALLDTFAEASDALDRDLWQLASEGPADALDRTENTQPVLLTASVAIYRLLAASGAPTPAVAAGHSLGEYSALVAADALSLADGVRLVAERGRLMQGAVPVGDGSMAAILGLDDEVVSRCCAAAGGEDIVAPANFNAPGQVVIAGEAAAVERASEQCRQAGAKRVMALSVSVPSHCALMQPAAEAFGLLLDDVQLATPRFPVVQNTDADIASDAQGIRQRLLDQLHAPVRWTACVQRMAELDVSVLYECGPGKVLSGLVKRIDRSLDARPLGNAEALQALVGA